MTTAELSSYLDQGASRYDKYAALRRFLLEKLEEWHTHPERADAIAGQITFLIGTDFHRGLSDEDPYLWVLEAAADLDLPRRFRGERLNWQAFEAMIKTLPG